MLALPTPSSSDSEAGHAGDAEASIAAPEVAPAAPVAAETSIAAPEVAPAAPVAAVVMRTGFAALGTSRRRGGGWSGLRRSGAFMKVVRAEKKIKALEKDKEQNRALKRAWNSQRLRAGDQVQIDNVTDISGNPNAYLPQAVLKVGWRCSGSHSVASRHGLEGTHRAFDMLCGVAGVMELGP